MLQIVAVTVGIPSFDGLRGAPAYSIDVVNRASLTITAEGTETTVPLVRTPPTPGVAAALGATLSTPVTVSGEMMLAVTLESPPYLGPPGDPPVGPVPTTPVSPPTPGDGVCPTVLNASGASQLVLQNVFVTLLVEDETSNPLAFTDWQDQPTGTVPLFQPGLRDERRIRFEQELIEALGRLVAGFDAFPRVAAFFQRQLDLAEARLRALVPEDARFTVGGPDLGTGDVPATLTSVDASGNPIETYDLTLRPGSPVRSVPLVAIPSDSRIASGPAGGLVFVRAEAGGRLVVQAPGYADAVADVIDGE
jgi:hypothetical protein